VSILMELGVTDPVPALQAPVLPDQSQQCFWGGSQAGYEQVGGLKWLSVAPADGLQLGNPVGADPGLADVIWRCRIA
jgi:hypothetical protein